jgi:adenosylcobinamide-phosphate synthase
MNLATKLLLSLALDCTLGEPNRFHPLVGFGKLANKVEEILHPGSKAGEESNIVTRSRGLIATALLILPFVIATHRVKKVPYLGTAFEVLLLYLCIGAVSLEQHANEVTEALDADDLVLARLAVSKIVSRDTQSLPAEAVAKAAIESVLENGNDAVFAPLAWFCLAGAEGAVLFRLANTLDAMWGYKNQRYQHFGWAAARFDDILGFLPARLTSLTYALVGDTYSGLNCWRHQAPLWYSPNAGPVMATGAGALNLLLGGDASYGQVMKKRPLLGIGKTPAASDIGRATGMIKIGVAIWSVAAILGGILFARARR